MEKIDRKITPRELEEKGLIVDGVEILPPIAMETQAQKRQKRELSFFKLFGKVYYQASELIEWANKHKVSAIN